MAMSDTKTSDLIRKVTAEAKKKLGAARFADAQTFIARYFANTPVGDVSAYKPGDLSALALHHFDLAANRPKDKLLVRVFNPTLKTDGYDSRA
jgi:glutamate dehydrogenase